MITLIAPPAPVLAVSKAASVSSSWNLKDKIDIFRTYTEWQFSINNGRQWTPKIIVNKVTFKRECWSWKRTFKKNIVKTFCSGIRKIFETWIF